MLFVDALPGPIYRFEFTKCVTEGDLERFWAEHERIYEDGVPYRSIIAAIDVPPPPGWLLARQARWMRDTASARRRIFQGGAFVLDTPALVMALRMLLVLAPLPAPCVVVRTHGQALTWMRGQQASDLQAGNAIDPENTTTAGPVMATPSAESTGT